MIYRAAMLGAAGGAFSPDDIAGLQLWLDASDTSTITESSGAVSQWDDKSGNANHATQGTASLQPSTGANSINSRNVLTYADDVLAASNVVGTASFTVVSVFERTSGAADIILGTNNTNVYFGVSQSGSASSTIAGSSGTPSYRVDGSDLVSPTRDDLFTATGGSPHVITGVLDGGFDAVEPNTLPFAYRLASSSFNLTGGYLAEYLVYSGVLDASDIASLEAYLASKWGITL